MTDKKELYAEAQVLLAKVNEALKEVEAFADQHELTITWGGPTYGMGGWYVGDKEQREVMSQGWEASSGSC